MVAPLQLETPAREGYIDQGLLGDHGNACRYLPDQRCAAHLYLTVLFAGGAGSRMS